MQVSKTRNAKRTKERIVKAAERLFAENGYTKTTIKDISKKSKASGSLILFHFKNKRNIYNAVKSSIIQRYTDNQELGNPVANTFQAKLEYIVTNMFNFYRDNPKMMRLANWAQLEGDVDPWPGEDDLHHSFIEIIESSQDQGVIRSDLSAMNILIMICGSIHIWWEYHTHFMRHLKNEENPELADENYFHELLSFIMRGLTDK